MPDSRDSRMRVSIVVPVFNVARYLDRCLESLVGQSYEDIEIILVDDGSTDECPAKCDEWAGKDPRIRVIHQDNAGIGLARNSGMKVASGDAVCFVDSDDYVDVDLVEKAVSKMITVDADVVVYGFKIIGPRGLVVKADRPPLIERLSPNEVVVRDFLPQLMGDPPGPRCLIASACAMLLNMRVIRDSGWEFVSERSIISEDYYSALKLYSLVDSVSTIEETPYCYCMNEGSTTHRFRIDRFAENDHFYLKCLEACEEEGHPDEVRASVAFPYLANYLGALKQLWASKIPSAEKQSLIRDALTSPVLQDVLANVDMDKLGQRQKLFWRSARSGSVYLVSTLLWLRRLLGP